MSAPVLTLEQRRAGSQKAAADRAARRLLKDALHEGLSPIQALDYEVAGGMKLTEFLGAVPGLGRAKIAAIMSRLGVASSKRVRGLGARQRRVLVGILELREMQ